MPWTRMSPPDDLVRWDVPKEITGTFLGGEIIHGTTGSSMRYQVENGSGKVCFYGTKMLDAALATIAPATAVRIAYLGEKQTLRGTQFKRFDVFAETLDRID